MITQQLSTVRGHALVAYRPQRCASAAPARLTCNRRCATQSSQDRDHPTARPFDDPHKTPPPRPAAAAAHAHHAPAPPPPQQQPSSASFDLPPSLSTSDLEFGADAITGSTLETPRQLAHQYRHSHQQQQGQGQGQQQQGERDREAQERLHQADIAREASEGREAAQGIARLVLEGLREEKQAGQQPKAAEEHKGLPATYAELEADESTAAEREDRYAGIMQALDSLGARDTRGASDGEDERHSPEAARLTVSGSGEHEEESEFDAIRHTVDELGEGEEAAELIMRSYAGRDLESEALGTLDPSDNMPHPGDRYLRPSAVPAHMPPPGGMAARLNAMHDRPDFEARHGPMMLPPARGAASSSQGQQHHRASPGMGSRGGGSRPPAAWIPPSDSPTAAARAQHQPVGVPEEEEGGQPQAQDQARNQAQQAQQARLRAEGMDGMGADDDQNGVGGLEEDAWQREGPVGGGPVEQGSGAEVADDQIGYEPDAMLGYDAMYYADEPAVNGAVGCGPAGSSGVNFAGGPDAFDVERDALQGSDAMYY